MALWEERHVLSMVANWWKITGALNQEWVDCGHGGYVETSAMLHYYLDLVDITQAREVKFKNLVPR